MVVRGAPAIGISAAYGMAIAQKMGEDMSKAYNILAASRPTAVNLLWALERVSVYQPMPMISCKCYRDSD